MSTYRGVLHKGEEARISNLVFVKDVEKFEEEPNMLFFFLVDKFLESCKVNRSVDWKLEVVIEPGWKDGSNLIGNRKLVTLLQIRSQLGMAFQFFLGCYFALEPFLQSRVGCLVEIMFLLSQRFGGLLSYVLFCLFDWYTAAALIAVVVWVPIRVRLLLHIWRSFAFCDLYSEGIGESLRHGSFKLLLLSIARFCWNLSWTACRQIDFMFVFDILIGRLDSRERFGLVMDVRKPAYQVFRIENLSI